jgi:recombination protein RecA
MGVNENDRIIRNPIADVVKTGKKECFKVKTLMGFEIETTEDHKFYQGVCYTPLKELQPGDVIYVHNNTTFKCRNKQESYDEIFVKYYYKGKKKIVGKKHSYYRVRKSRLIYEAYLNNITIDQYINLLNSGIKKMPNDWVIVPEGFHIHHKDENKKNNNIDNLELINPSDHGKLHANKRQDNLRFIAVKDKIVSIEAIGERETYDIKCFYPYNNFIAAGFVVHNSGKSTISLHLIANAQKQNLKCLLIDGENSFHPLYAASLGVSVDDLLIMQLDKDGAEKCYDVLENLLRTGEIGLVIIDSQTSLLSKKAMTGSLEDSVMGIQAKLMSASVPKILNAAEESNALVVYISQFREKIGVMFGSPETTSGGNAIRFYAHVRIEVRKTVEREDGVAFANETRCKVIKNKMAPPFKEATFRINFGQGIDTSKEVLDVALETGIIKRSGSWYSYKDDKLAQGEDNVISLFNDNPELRDEIKNFSLEELNNESTKTTEKNTSEEVTEENQPEQKETGSQEEGARQGVLFNDMEKETP